MKQENDLMKQENDLETTKGMIEAIPMASFILRVFSWFCVPISVLIRRDFGERWLSTLTYSFGGFILLMFTAAQTVGGALTERFASPYQQPTEGFGGIFQRIPPQEAPPEPSFFDNFMGHSMKFVLTAYILLGVYHFFIMWWRNRTFKPQHSYYRGASYLEPLAAGLMDLVNMIIEPIIRLLTNLLPAGEKARITEIPPAFPDVTEFNDRIFEPFVVAILAIVVQHFGGGSAATWLGLSAFSLALISTVKYSAELDSLLDMRDKSIEVKYEKESREARIDAEYALEKAGAMKERAARQHLIMEQIAANVKETPEIGEELKKEYPSLMDIIEEVNSKPKG